MAGATACLALVLGGSVHRFNESAGRGTHFGPLRAGHQLAYVLRMAHGDLRQRCAFVRPELEDEVTGVAHLMETAH
jgi:hypothetical protein